MKSTLRAALLLALSYFLFAPAAGATPAGPAGAEAPAPSAVRPSPSSVGWSPQRRARHSRRSAHARRSARAASAGDTSSDDYYTNVDGERVHRPVFTRSAPAGASAQCRDGSYSFSRHRRGTCSHHGGVARWL